MSMVFSVVVVGLGALGVEGGKVARGAAPLGLGHVPQRDRQRGMLERLVEREAHQVANLERLLQFCPAELGGRHVSGARGGESRSGRRAVRARRRCVACTLTDIQRAVRFFYLQQNAFGGKVAGQSWGTATTAPPLNLLRIEENLSAAHLRLAGAYIENMDWRALVQRYDRPHTFFYLDPPYWETEGYAFEFGIEQYERMASDLRALKGKAIVSLNDHPEIRRIFAGFEIESVPISYTVGGGGRAVDRTEVIIYSWDRRVDPVGLF